MLLYIVENMNQNYDKIPCFVEKNPKQQLKFMVYQNKIYGFILQSSYNSSHTSPQNCVFKLPPLF